MTSLSRAGVTTQLLTGPASVPWLAALVELRLTVFREYPYCYAGDAAAEERYVHRYAERQHAALALAVTGGHVVGAGTGIPLGEESSVFTAPFRGVGIPVAEVYYVGELLLYPAYRCQGLGSRLLDELAAYATESGFRNMACATVVRGQADPQRPPGYRPIDRFCTAHGFSRRDDLTIQLDWQESDGQIHTHPMAFWLRRL